MYSFDSIYIQVFFVEELSAVKCQNKNLLYFCIQGQIVDCLNLLHPELFLKHCSFSYSLTVAHQDVLKEVEVEYITMPGWNSNTEQVRIFEDLPPNAQAYVLKLEELVSVPGRYTTNS